MYLEILNNNQKKLLPFLKTFSSNFGLIGDTAIALQIGHRQSIDFDLFTNKPFRNFNIQKKLIETNQKITHVFIDEKDEYTIQIHQVKVTFLLYPFKIEFKNKLDDYFKMADLLTLGALKAYALGRRAKWKDYVDLYFILNKYHSIKELINQANKIFGENFNEKNFRTQLTYFKDIDKSEEIIYQPKFAVKDNDIEKILTKFSLLI